VKSLFSELALVDVHQEVARNIISLRQSQDLFDDITDDPVEWQLAQSVEAEIKPPLYQSQLPIIHRPFEDAQWFNAIAWPFKHWQVSRFSDGSHGVWYGADSVATTIFETAFHWYHGLLCDAGFERERVIAERKVYFVTCSAALLDLRQATKAYPDLLDPVDYTYAQSVGRRIHKEGHPGLLIQSVRHPQGENYAIFNPGVLSNPQLNCQLTYCLIDNRINVERQPGTTWMSIEVASFS